MTVTFVPTGIRHGVERQDEADSRIWWTRCSQRFVWGGSRGLRVVGQCGRCFP